MKTLMTCIKNSIEAQDAVIALKDCVTGWDGTVNEETILQGILDRYQAMGASDVVEYGIRMERTSLRTARIVAKGGITIMAFYTSLVPHILDPSFFRQEEINKIKKFMLEEFHHLH